MKDFGGAMNMTIDDQRREQGRERTEAYRERRRRGLLLIQVEVAPRQFAALERLALLDVGERDKACIAWAVSRFLDAAPLVSALGDALWPADEDADVGDAWILICCTCRDSGDAITKRTHGLARLPATSPETSFHAIPPTWQLQARSVFEVLKRRHADDTTLRPYLAGQLEGRADAGDPTHRAGVECIPSVPFGTKRRVEPMISGNPWRGCPGATPQPSRDTWMLNIGITSFCDSSVTMQF
jgi:hypothetical protein